MADFSVDGTIGQNTMQDDDDRGQSSAIPAVQEKGKIIDDEDTPPPPPSSPKSNADNGYPDPNDYDDDNDDNINPIISSPRTKTQRQRDKMQRRVPGSLDLDYITPRIIGMAPPRAKFGAGGVGDDAAAIKQQSKRQKRQKGNDPGELSTFLEKRHSRRYLLFNVSDEDADDRSLLLLGRQVVHLPWGSPKIPHPNDGRNNNNNNTATPASCSPMRESPYSSFFRRDPDASSSGDAGGVGKSSPSSGTPAISRVMDICYALHAYLSIPPQELPVELLQQQEQREEQNNDELRQHQFQHQQQQLKTKKGKHHHRHHKPSTVACIYCGNGKTRTGVIVACYLRFCNEVPDALSGFDIFCQRRGIMSSSSSSSSLDDISSHIPPSLRQFFSNFDELVTKKQYPYPDQLMLQSIQLQGVPVDDMPCVDIFEYGDVMKQQIYSSHDDTSLNEWEDEEGTYKIGQLLSQDFTLVCRFGGEFAGDDQDPSKVLFRYVNSPKFLNEGSFELGMVNVDMMRRYADSFDEEDFLLTLVFEGFDEDDVVKSSSRKKKLMFGASKFDGHVLEGIDLILEGWRILSHAHLSRFPAETENELMMDSSFVLNVLGTDVDFRPIALQLTNGDIGLARVELLGGLFGFLFNRNLQQTNLDETEHSRSDQKSYLSSELSVLSTATTSQTDQSTSYDNDVDLQEADESINLLMADDTAKLEFKDGLVVPSEEVGQQTNDALNIETTSYCIPTIVKDTDNLVKQEVVSLNAAFIDQTDLAKSANIDVTPVGAKTEDVSQTNKSTPTNEDDKDDELLCVVRCCAGLGIAVVGAGAAKTTPASTSVGTAATDCIVSFNNEVAFDAATKQKSLPRQPSMQCLGDALTESIDSTTDEQVKIPSLDRDDKNGDEETIISEDYLKYCKMFKMGLPTGLVENAMQRDGLDPGKYLLMSKVGLPEGAVRNAIQRDGLDPSLMDVLKIITTKESISHEAEEEINQSTTGYSDEAIVEKSNENDNRGEEQAPETRASSLKVAAMAVTTAQKRAQTDETDMTIIMNSSSLAAAATRNKTQKVHKSSLAVDEAQVGGSSLTIAVLASVKESESAMDDAPAIARGSSLSIAAATAAQEKAQKAKDSPSTEDDAPAIAKTSSLDVAALAAAAAKKKAQKVDTEADATGVVGPMSIADMAAAAAQKKTQKEVDTEADAAGAGGPISVSAMAAAAAQKKTQKKDDTAANSSEKVDSEDVVARAGGPMSIADMAAAAAQKKTQKIDTEADAAGAGGPLSIAAMAAAAAQKKTQKKDDTAVSSSEKVDSEADATGARGPISISAMAAASAQKKIQKDEDYPSTEDNAPATAKGSSLDVAALAAAAAKKKAQKVDTEADATGVVGQMSIADMAAAAAQKKTQKEVDTEADAVRAGGPMSIADMTAAETKKKSQSSSDSSSLASGADLTIRNHPNYKKFFQMLKMGLPMEVVKHAMTRDGFDPSIMDLDPDKALSTQRLLSKIVKADVDLPLKEDEKYQKYFKMLKMGLPMGAVKNAMQRDGLDPDIMDLNHDKSVASQIKSGDAGGDDGPPLKEDEKYQKYFKMLKMGLPMGAVKNAMQRDGLDPDIMDLDHDKSVASQMKGDAGGDDGPPLKDDEKYQKYFKMLKMGLPMGAVKNAMQRDGLDPDIMDLDHDKSVASQMKGDAGGDDGPPLKDDEKYQKYFKMLKMGLPMGAVKNAMQRDGLDPSIMHLDHDKSVASQMNVELVDKGPPLKDDEKYQKYFKMLKMGLPMGAVKNAMSRDGFDPSVMDLDHEKSEEYQKTMASQKGKTKVVITKKLSKEPKKPAVRRKKIFWSPIDESKVDDNSLWSMIKGAYDFESLKVDQAEFESLFTDTSKPGDKKKETLKPEASKQKKSVQVIDAKRGMNGGIILARLKIEFSVLADMVSEMDSGKLDDTQMMALREFLPTKDEKAAIDQYIQQASKTQESLIAAINDFCACEKYMYAMMKVDKADEKFQCMLFKYQFDHKLNELMDAVTTLISACEEVQKSVRLRKLMAMILMLGNQINTGGSGSMAHGFTLDALLKLDEAKAFDKKTSVLQYLVKLVKDNEPDLLNVHDEMPSIGPAESVVVEALVSELKELDEQLKHVNATATEEGMRIRDGKRTGPTLTALDRLRQQKTKIKAVEGVNMFNQTESIQLTSMEKFVLAAKKRSKEAFSRIEEVQENFKGVLTYFGEKPTMSSTDFFGTMNKFVAAFDAALVVVRRIEALNAAEEKKAAAQRAKEDADRKLKSKIKETAIKSLTAKINRLTAEKESKENAKIPDKSTLKEKLKKNDSHKGFSEVGISKGTLDLTGQRKTFADPFAGPEGEQETEKTVTEEIQPAGEGLSSISTESNEKLVLPPSSPIKTPVTGGQKHMGFFPATSPRHTIGHTVSFDKNNNTGKETSPAYQRATFAGPHMSPFAKGIKNETLTEQKQNLHHIKMPVFDDESGSSSSLVEIRPNGIAIGNSDMSAAAAAQKKAKNAEEIEGASGGGDSPMGIAAMAAAAAQKKAKKAEEIEGASGGGDSPMGIAAMAAAAAQKKAKKAEDIEGASGGGDSPMGIAAMAAAAAQKKAKKAEEIEGASGGGDSPMGIAAMAAAAAQKKAKKAEEIEGASGGGDSPISIAAMAAAAAQKKAKKDEEIEGASGGGDSPMGIAAMAAAAAQKKAKKTEEIEGASGGGDSPMGIAAMAAAAAQKKAKKDEEIEGASGGGDSPIGIAAMAAAAAQKKAKKAEANGSNEDNTTETKVGHELLCSACDLSKHSNCFSKTQRSKGSNARCMDCVAAAVKLV